MPVRWLAERIDKDPWTRTFVVAPSATAAAAQRRALARDGVAMLGVDFVTIRGLARGILQLQGIAFPQKPPDPLEEREALYRALPDDELGRFARRFPSALRQLQRTLRELERRVDPDELEGLELSVSARRVTKVWKDLRTALEHRGGRFRMLRQARSAVEQGKPLAIRVLVTDPVLDDDELLPETDAGSLLQAIRAQDIPVEFWNGGPEETTTPVVHNAADTFAELRLAAQLCLEASANGLPCAEMVVAVPRLDVYLPHLARAFAAENVPLHVHAEQPLFGHPLAALALHAARVLFTDARRDAFLALLETDWLRHPLDAQDRATLQQLARSPGIQGPRRFGERLQEILPAALQERVAAWPRDLEERSIRDRCASLGTFLDDSLDMAKVGSPDVADRLADVLTALHDHSSPDACSGERFVLELEELLRSRGTPLLESRPGGVQIVEWRDALAIPATHLHLVGLTSDFSPVPLPALNFLNEKDRDELSLPGQRELQDKEDGMFARLLHRAPSIHLSWPRRSAIGPRSPSRPLQNLLESAGHEVHRQPAHPLDRASQRIGVESCPRDLALSFTLLQSKTKAQDEDLATFVRGRDLRVLAQARRLDRFHAADLSRDGDVGRELAAQICEDVLGVSAFEGLGRCPQQFLFQSMLGRNLLPQESEALEVPQDQLGLLVHRCLEKTYGAFLDRLADAEDPTALIDDMQAEAERQFDAEFELRGLSDSIPGLFSIQRRRWLHAVQNTLAVELGYMALSGSRPRSVERGLEATLTVRSPHDDEERRVALRGRADRVDEMPGDHLAIVDFKTGRNTDRFHNLSLALKGESMQLFLYGMMLEASTGSEVRRASTVAVREGMQDDRDEAPILRDFRQLRSCLSGEHAEAMAETLAAILDLRANGTFVLKRGQHCRYCRFQLACRRYHPPSGSRVDQLDDAVVRRYFQLRTKSFKKTMLGPSAGRSKA